MIVIAVMMVMMMMITVVVAETLMQDAWNFWVWHPTVCLKFGDVWVETLPSILMAVRWGSQRSALKKEAASSSDTAVHFIRRQYLKCQWVYSLYPLWTIRVPHLSLGSGRALLWVFFPGYSPPGPGFSLGVVQVKSAAPEVSRDQVLLPELGCIPCNWSLHQRPWSTVTRCWYMGLP